MRSSAFDGIAKDIKPQSAPDGISEATKPRKKSSAFDGIAEDGRPQFALDGVAEVTKPRKKNYNLQERHNQSRKSFRKKASPALFHGIAEVDDPSTVHDCHPSSSHDGIAEMALRGPPGIFYASHAPPALYPELSEASSSKDGIAEVAKHSYDSVSDGIAEVSKPLTPFGTAASIPPAGHASPAVHFDIFDDSDIAEEAKPVCLGIAEEAQPCEPAQFVYLNDVAALLQQQQQQQQQQLQQLARFHAALIPASFDGTATPFDGNAERAVSESALSVAIAEQATLRASLFDANAEVAMLREECQEPHVQCNRQASSLNDEIAEGAKLHSDLEATSLSDASALQEKLCASLFDANAEVAMLRDECEDFQLQLSCQASSLNDEIADKAKLHSELLEANDEIAEKAKRHSEHEASVLSDASADRERLSASLFDANAEVVMLRDECQDFQLHFNRQASSLNDEIADKAKLHSELLEANDEIAEKAMLHSELASVLSDASADQEKLSASLFDANAEVAMLRDECKAFQLQLTRKASSLNDEIAEKAKLHSEILEANDEIAELASLRSQLERLESINAGQLFLLRDGIAVESQLRHELAAAHSTL